MLEINIWLQNIATPFWDKFFLFISNLTNELLYVVIIAMIYFLKDKKKAIKMAILIMTNMSLNLLLKDICMVERPYVNNSKIVNKDIKTGYGYSFPSGHSQFNSGFFTALCLNFKIKAYYFLIVLFVMLVGFSRIYLGVHTTADVFFGIILGFAWCLLLNEVIDKIISRKIYILYFFLIIGIFNLVFNQNIDSVKILLLYFGFILGYTLENKYVNFEIPVKKKERFINVLIFVTGALIIMIAFEYITVIYISVFKYFLTGIWASYVCPLLCSKKGSENEKN